MSVKPGRWLGLVGCLLMFFGLTEMAPRLEFTDTFHRIICALIVVLFWAVLDLNERIVGRPQSGQRKEN